MNLFMEFQRFYRILICIVILGSTQLSAQDQVEVFVADFQNKDLRSSMETNASALLTQVNQTFKDDTKLTINEKVITSYSKTTFVELWNNTPFYIPESKIIEAVAKLTNGKYEMRNIPTYFVDPNGVEHYEEAVIQFNASGVVSDFKIGIAAHRYQKIMEEGTDKVDKANRKKILTFIEDFRTSYNQKDINFISNVFSDQALIIVGRVLENTGETSALEKQVEYLQFNKDEYIDRLKRLFEVNEWINVGFEDIGIIRHPKFPDIYGVSLTQYYSSTIYSDEGYLFLLIDFKNPDEPMIHVRTWQPKQSTPEDEVFNIGYMEIF